MYLNYPNNPTGAVVPDGLFERAVEFAREHDVLVVHDASYTETTFDGYVAPSFLETPGAKEVGVEVFSLSKGWNMTGWRTAAIVGQRRGGRGLLAAQDQHRLGHVRGGAAGRRRGARRRAAAREMSAIYQRRRDLVCDALREIGVDVTPPQGHDLRLGAGARGPHLGLLLRAGAGGVRRRGLARLRLRAQRRGLLPHLADRRRRAAGARPSSGCARAWEAERMHYCGVVASRRALLQLGVLEEVRTPEPPIRLSALFFEPGAAGAGGRASCARSATWWWRSGAPLAGAGDGRPARDCDALLRRRGVAPPAPDTEMRRGSPTLLRDLPALRPADEDGAEGAGARRAPTTRLAAVRDQRRRRVLRAPGPPAARQAPPARDAARGSTSSRRPRRRRRRRPLAPPDRGARRGRRALCAPPLRRRARLLARRPARRASWCCPARRCPSSSRSQGVLPPVERLPAAASPRRLDRWSEAATAERRDPLRRGHPQPARAPARALIAAGPEEPDLARAARAAAHRGRGRRRRAHPAPAASPTPTATSARASSPS